MVTGDFNVASDSALFGDFILVAGPITVQATDLLLADKQDLPSGPGYVSDHVGLRARVSLSR